MTLMLSVNKALTYMRSTGVGDQWSYTTFHESGGTLRWQEWGNTLLARSIGFRLTWSWGLCTVGHKASAVANAAERAMLSVVHVSVSWSGVTRLGSTVATWLRVGWRGRRGVTPSSADKSAWVYTCISKPLHLVASQVVGLYMGQRTSWFLCSCANR